MKSLKFDGFFIFKLDFFFKITKMVLEYYSLEERCGRKIKIAKKNWDIEEGPAKEHGNVYSSNDY